MQEVNYLLHSPWRVPEVNTSHPTLTTEVGRWGATDLGLGTPKSSPADLHAPVCFFIFITIMKLNQTPQQTGEGLAGV